VARILGAKGLRGAVRVEPLTDVPERLAVGSLLYLEGEVSARRVRLSETGGRVPALALEGTDTREQAEALAGRYLEVDAEPLAEGVYYWHQLVGLRVTDEAGTELGSVAEVFRAGENEVYRVEGPGGELLLPSLRDVILSIDLEAGTMVVRYDVEEVR
jgi:16S rRNA processing protein RimM